MMSWGGSGGGKTLVFSSRGSSLPASSDHKPALFNLTLRSIWRDGVPVHYGIWGTPPRRGSILSRVASVSVCYDSIITGCNYEVTTQVCVMLTQRFYIFTPSFFFAQQMNYFKKKNLHLHLLDRGIFTHTHTHTHTQRTFFQIIKSQIYEKNKVLFLSFLYFTRLKEQNISSELYSFKSIKERDTML